MSRGNFSQLKNRILYILEDKGWKPGELAKNLRTSPAYITQLKSGERDEISDILAELIAVKLGYRFEWISKGEGHPKNGSKINIPIIYKPKEINDDYLKLPVYMIAGAGNALHIIETEPIEHIIIPKRLLKPGIVPIKVRGDSMEKTILEGAVVGVDTICKDLSEGHIYCCYLPLFGAILRRIKWRDDGLLLVPDNTTNYKPKFVTFNEARENLIYGKVVWIFQSMP